eukprot:TRINITY_DN12725_c0_g1_i2.p2 TRINITY_DN12725_c0_g1~~TRINITY_DN12725_c0_g1_i2.p2  ORF type:complete len:302 (-),score=30.40 TRINITY_DN12725_c0_g1_i2:559-1422(-)
MISNQQTSSILPVPVKYSNQEARLRSWIYERGGYVHPDLKLDKSTQCPADRGVIATAEIPLGVVAEQPLILIPEECCIRSEDAQQQISAMLENQGLPNLADFDVVSQMILFLSYHKSVGDESLWAPYINLLPPKPPCAWAMPKDELDGKLQKLSKSLSSGWDKEILQAKMGIYKQASMLEKGFGKALQIDVDLIVWSTGQVLSRAFGNDEGIVLVPFIDMCNHASQAPSINGWDRDDDKVMMYVISGWDGNSRSLTIGDEVFISYIDPKQSPLNTFINYGCLPAFDV